MDKGGIQTDQQKDKDIDPINQPLRSGRIWHKANF